MADAALLSEAALWHERLLDAPDPGTRRAFEAWRLSNAAHADAYERVRGARTRAASLAGQPALLSLRQDALARATLVRRPLPARRIAIAAGVLMLAGGPLAAWGISQWTPRTVQPVAEQTFRTGIGQQTDVTLPDGSQVTLDTNSRLTIRYDEDERKVALQGQGWFRLAASPRPFVIDAGAMRMTADTGTFDIRTDPGRVRVLAVIGGLSVGAADAGPSVALHEGDLLSATGSDAAIRRPADTTPFTGWRSGVLQFQDARLAEVAAELNRYRRQPIRVADARAADLRISGSFGTAETPAFVEALTTGFPVRVKRDGDTGILVASK